MTIDTWDEVRTAYHVARAGTVSGAADAMGVHHATVIRHIDALEAALGVRLFQRHARGYTPTEAGADLLSVARAADDQFAQLAGRLRGGGEGITGDLVVTTLAGVSALLIPGLIDFRAAHPGLVVRLLTDERLYRLEYGEAHVAVRAGPAPSEPDNVVQPFRTERYAPYAAPVYVARHGLPGSADDFGVHWFVAHDDATHRAPANLWLRARVDAGRIAFRTSDELVLARAVALGAGIGFLPVDAAASDLVQVLPPRPEWEAPLWLVTHVALHRTAKVQALLTHLKAAADRDG